MENQDSKSSQQRVSNLEPLPDSSHGYWQYAEVHTNLSWQSLDEARKEVKSSLKEHYFVRISGHQAQCKHCEWGFQLDSGDRIKEGHLYDKQGKLVI